MVKFITFLPNLEVYVNSIKIKTTLYTTEPLSSTTLVLFLKTPDRHKDTFPSREYTVPQLLLIYWQTASLTLSRNRREGNLIWVWSCWVGEARRGSSPVGCPLHFGGGASAAAPPGTPEKVSAETDLCRGQHWKQVPKHKQRHIWEEKQEKC